MSAFKTTIIAEAAQGFEGDPSVARLLVRAAAVGHADMVKFQLVYADELATPNYQYYSLFKKLEMPFAAWEAVSQDARNSKIQLVFDVYGMKSLAHAVELGAASIKIHATDFFNEELINAALERFPQVFFSAGGIRLEEVSSFLKRLEEETLRKLTMLCGFQAEPTEIADNNLRRLAAIRLKFPNLNLGFMDHADGDSDEAGWLGVLALPLGITAIEKHITLDRSFKLEDFISALDAKAFARYVDRIRSAEKALGSDDLTLSSAEELYRRKALKIVVASKVLEKGTTLKDSDLSLLRTPIDGQKRPFERKKELIDRTLKKSVSTGQAIFLEDIS